MKPTDLPPDVPVPHCRTLAEEMAEIRADVNGINTELGLRPYRVFSVRLHWSGGEPGRGTVTRTLQREYLPRPKVSFRTRREATPMGWIERGVVVLTEVNALLPPELVEDLFAADQPLQLPGEESFFEITLDGRYAAAAAGGAPERRRFVLVEPPERRDTDWRVTLRQQAAQRAPDGTPAGAGRVF
jgi:hypothetical protein